MPTFPDCFKQSFLGLPYSYKIFPLPFIQFKLQIMYIMPTNSISLHQIAAAK